jgi:hypothetical protein
MQANFYLVAFGMPVVLVLFALLGAVLFRGSDADLLDWRPTRSPQTESELEVSDVDQMLAAQNRYRRQRGAPERSLEDVIAHPWTGLERQSSSRIIR